MAPRIVRCRSLTPRAPDASSSKRLGSRLTIPCALMTFMRAAASSMANGRPSRRLTISVTGSASDGESA